jgi:hypothetical protein
MGILHFVHVSTVNKLLNNIVTYIHSQEFIVQGGPLASFSGFLNHTHTFRHTVGLLWMSDQPSQRPLPTQDRTT